ncbi:hypothetical protein C8Q70DRAFT_953537 [Cubamyces menziesii]|nr:hypothetical protein C8Q70DRAFT_953537 [Cubamyces menziesii]
MQHEWTDQKREEWLARRTERRRKNPSPSRDPERPRAGSLDAERTELLNNLHNVTTKTFAWELGKYPPEPYPAPFSGKLYLPICYMGDDYARTVKFTEGQDLNLLVYQFYNAPPDADYDGPNFVTPHKPALKRHEHMGPAPHVTGFRFDAAERTARIEWWDAYVQALWIGRRTWRIEVYFDDAVGGWVSRPRGDFDRAPDLERYMGP